MARRTVSRVLVEQIEAGALDEEEAAALARRILRDNPAELYRLKL